MINSNSITVTTYNIHKGMSPLNRHVVTQRMGLALKQINPDIMCLQEVQGQMGGGAPEPEAGAQPVFRKGGKFVGTTR